MYLTAALLLTSEASLVVRAELIAELLRLSEKERYPLFYSSFHMFLTLDLLLTLC